MKIAIIGNGILGLMSALEIKKKFAQAEIHIIGKDERPGCASIAAAAMLNSFAELEYDSLQNDFELFKFELSRKATKLWPALLDELKAFMPNITYGFGTFIIHNTATDMLDDENFSAIEHFTVKFSEPHEIVNPIEIPNYSPSPQYRALKALYLPREGWVNPKELLKALTLYIKSFNGVYFHDTEARTINTTSQSITNIVCDNLDRISIDKVILAPGANLGKIIHNNFPDIKIQNIFYGVGASIEIENENHFHSHCIRTTNRGLACGIYSAPYGDCKTLIGASNYINTEPMQRGKVGNIYTLLKAAMEQINQNFYSANLNTVNIGWRPTTADTFPLIGKTSIKNLWILGGTKRDGLHLSPVIAKDLISIILSEPVDHRYQWFAPEREIIRTLTRHAAVEKYIKHKINADYQHDFTCAKNRMGEYLQDYYRQKIESIHDQIGAFSWGIPVELVDMYLYGHIKHPLKQEIC